MSPVGLHLLMFPFPAQGHMLPMLDLAGELSRRGVDVTVLVTTKNLPLLDPLLSGCPSVSPLVLPFPSHPGVPAGAENLKDLAPSHFVPMKLALAGLYDPILRWASNARPPPDAIVSDFFLGWTEKLGRELKIPRVVFSPSGALAISISNSIWLEVPRRADPLAFPAIPGSPSFPWGQLSTMFRTYAERAGEPEWEAIRDGFLGNRRSWGHVFNTFSALEGAYLAHLRRDVGHPHVYAVGPLTSPEAAEGRGGRSSVPVGDVSAWLGRWPRGSVAYACFGSQAELAPEQAAAVEAGLQQSGAPFVWCAARGGGGGGVEERAGGRGLVINGWAPQVAILNHEAVGTFVTHCGWNSVLEGIAAGVAMVAWPMGADQFMNAWLLGELGVGVTVCEGANSVPDSDVLARAVADAADAARPEREKSRELQRGAREAVRIGGSSDRDLDVFILELRGCKFEAEAAAMESP